MAISFIASTSGTGTDSAVTTGSINTTGANLIVVSVAVDSGATPTITDNKSNTYTALTSSSLTVKNILYYCVNPTVGTEHTFSNNTAFNYCTLCVQAFSGVKTSSPVDQQSGATGTGSSTIQPGSITPTENNELVVAGLGFNLTGTPISINSSFTKTDEQNFVGGTAYGSSIAYIIQTTASAVNPTWTRNGTNAMATRLASFKSEPVVNRGFFSIMV